MVTACLAGACLAGLLAACSSGPHAASGAPAMGAPAAGSSITAGPVAAAPVAGTLAGHLYAVGGPAPGAPRPWPGTVTLTGPGEHRYIAVGAAGRFSVQVPAGIYIVAGRSPRYEDGTGVCRAARPATVTVGHLTQTDIFCQLK
jgi:hypothetical protein